MKQVKKLAAGILIFALTFSAAGAENIQAAPAEQKAEKAAKIASPIALSIPEDKVPSYKAGEKKNFTLNVENTGEETLTDICIEPKLRKNADKWPFKTEYQNYGETIEKLEKGEKEEVTFVFTAREDVKTTRYALNFDVKAVKENGEAVTTMRQVFYINAVGGKQDSGGTDDENDKKDDGQDNDKNSGKNDTQNSDKNNNGTPSSQPQIIYVNAGGSDLDGFEGGSAYNSGGDSSGSIDSDGAGVSGNESVSSGSVPRVIVTGFSTDPGKVKAGSDFTLTIYLKNTSNTTRVKNMLFDLAAPTEGTDEQTTAPAFLPVSGASSIYLDGISAGGTASISIALNAKADLVQKPYSIDLSMKYEDGNSEQIEGQSSISIPVKQNARFEFSEFEMTPETVEVGNEGNISCNLYNLGRMKLYNVRAVFEGKGIEKEELFLGNIEPGTSTSIDAMLEATEMPEGEGNMKMTLSYEDEAGKVSEEEKEFQMIITEPTDDVIMDDGEMMIEEEKGFPVIPIVIGAVVLLGIIGALIWKKRRKQRLMAEEQEVFLDELDGPAPDEQQ